MNELWMSIWENIRAALKKIADIGPFDPSDFQMVAQTPPGWKGDRWPLALDKLNAMQAGGLHTPEAQALYATMARQAALRLGLVEPQATSFGEFFGCTVSGFRWRFANLGSRIKRIGEAYAADSKARFAYREVRANEPGEVQPFFQDADVQARMQRAFEAARRLPRHTYEAVEVRKNK